MRENFSLILIIISIFVVTFLGAVFSPTFQEQKDFLELFFAFGGLLFIFSLLVVFASLGFHSFSLFLALFLAIIIFALGVLAGFIVVFITYTTWGVIFAIEVLLAEHNVKSAKKWFKERYTFKSFKKEFIVFYPLILAVYLMLEIAPSILYKESFIIFSKERILKEMRELLD